MALINGQGKYIKLYENGKYEIYRSEAARKRTKSSTSSDIIIKKYIELLHNLENQMERRYYDPSGFTSEYDPLEAEYQRYRYNLINHNTTEEYPLMAQYYPDVADSIPDIVEAGVTMDRAENSQEIYTLAKFKHRWGDTTDA